MDFGAFVEFMPGKDGLLHISEISWNRIDKMDGVFKEGEKIKVKLIEVDKKTGKFRLSKKALEPRPEGMPESSNSSGGNQGERRPQRRQPQN
jgi:polyribonucleotide nucleotidyltransferase